MVGRPVLFDTCILIDYLRGIPQARAVCDRTNALLSRGIDCTREQTVAECQENYK